jgi:hypothetical protein
MKQIVGLVFRSGTNIVLVHRYSHDCFSYCFPKIAFVSVLIPITSPSQSLLRSGLAVAKG